MDTITHFAAGACMGELIAGGRIGKKAMVVGGLAQLIPDVDFIFGLWMTPAANALAHRGFTHSFLFLLMVTPLVAWGARLWWGDKALSWTYWLSFLSAEIAAHLFLDAFNAYGTGWFEPFDHRRISFNAVFVADPLFSLPLGLALACLLFTRIQFRWRNLVSVIALSLSGIYLTYALVNKRMIDDAARRALAMRGISSEAYFTTPTPFNNWLWYIVATDSTGSHVGYRSVFDNAEDIHFEYFPRNEFLLEHTPADYLREVDLLKRLSQGHYTVELRQDTLIFNDLRFGQMLGWQYPRAGFVFHYYLKPALDNKVVLQRGRFQGWDRQTSRYFLHRMMGEERGIENR